MGVPTASPSIQVTASAGNVPVEMDKVAKALDTISTTPLDELRSKSEDALNRTNRAISDTVDKLDYLKKSFANTGGLDLRAFKGIENDLGKLANLGVDEASLQKISDVLAEVKAASKSPITIRLEEERAKALPIAGLKSDAVASGGRAAVDPTSTAAIQEARTRQFGPEKGDQLAAIDGELQASRSLDAQKAKAIAEQQSAAKAATNAERAEQADLRANLEAQIAAARQLQKQKEDALADAAEQEKSALADRLAGIRAEFAASEQLEAQKQRAIAERQAQERAEAKALRADLEAQIEASRQLQKQKEDALAEDAAKDAAAAKTKNRLLGKLVDKGLGAAGVNLPNVATDALGGIGAGLAAVLAAGQVSANARATQRTTGISGSSIGNAVGGFQQLPLIKQLSEAAGEAFAGAGDLVGGGLSKIGLGGLGDKVIGFTSGFSTTNQQAELDRLNEAAKVYDDLRNQAKETAVAEARVLRDNAATLQSIASQGKGQLLGGEARKRFDIATSAQVAVDNSESKRLAVHDDADKNISDIKAKFANDTANLTKTAGGPSGKEADDAKRELDRLRKESDRNVEQQKQRKVVADVQADNEKAGIQGNALVAQDIVSGKREDSAGVANTFEGIDKAARTTAAGPIAALRKQFDELKPSPKSLSDFQDKLGDLKVTQVKVEGEFIGLNSRDAQIQELIDSVGAGNPAVAQLRVELDANDAKAKAAALKEELRDSAARVSITLARTPQEKIAAEIKAASDKAKDDTGNAFKPEDIAKKTAAANSERIATNAAATREAAKTPQQKLAESVDSLKEQVAAGYLTQDEARKGLGEGIKDYADAVRTSRPDLMEAGSAQTDQFLAVASGSVVDASKPEIALAKEANSFLADILKAVSGGNTATALPLV